MKLTYITLLLFLFLNGCRKSDDLEVEKPLRSTTERPFLSDTVDADFSSFYKGQGSPFLRNMEYSKEMFYKFHRNRMYPNKWYINIHSHENVDTKWNPESTLWIADFKAQTKRKILLDPDVLIRDWIGSHFLMNKAGNGILYNYDYELNRTDTVLTEFSGSAQYSPDGKYIIYRQQESRDVCTYNIKKKEVDTLYSSPDDIRLIGWNSDSRSVLIESDVFGDGKAVFQVNIESKDTVVWYKGYTDISFITQTPSPHSWVLVESKLSILNLKTQEQRPFFEGYEYLGIHSIEPMNSSSDYLALIGFYTETKEDKLVYSTDFFLMDENGQNLRSVTFNFDELQEI